MEQIDRSSYVVDPLGFRPHFLRGALLRLAQLTNHLLNLAELSSYKIDYSRSLV